MTSMLLKLVVTLLLFFQRTDFVISFNKTITYNNYPEGCLSCNDYSCPVDPNECYLGFVEDTCDCCEKGRCARLEGDTCWNSTINELPKKRRGEGFCAQNYTCQLRNDLEPEDVPEATCVCLEQKLVCGSNKRTYPTPCALYEESKRYPDLNIVQRHLGPCPSLPYIYSAPENVEGELGHEVVLGCEAKGFPLPDIFWEFHSYDDNKRVLRLPYDRFEDGMVNNSESPDDYIRTSWLQIENLRQYHLGVYHCIANNSKGQASAFSTISII